MDRTTKVLLALIALGLFLNAGAQIVRPAQAQDANSILRSIDSHLQALTNGMCLNRKLCQ